MKNIYLCGFMGCGKSTVGPVLAKLLNMKFIDFDDYIENQAGESVQEIFKKYGEGYFRILEHSAAEQISKMGGTVAATGGGTVLSGTNVSVLKSGGIIVLVDVPFEIIKERLKNDTARPLLQKPDKEREMRTLYEKRMPLYRAACDCSVANDGSSPENVAHEIAAIPEIRNMH